MSLLLNAIILSHYFGNSNPLLLVEILFKQKMFPIGGDAAFCTSPHKKHAEARIVSARFSFAMVFLLAAFYAACTATKSCPKGRNANTATLKYCMPKGMPMIVMQ